MKNRLGDYIQEISLRNKSDEQIPVYSVTNTHGFCKDYFGKEVASKDKKTYKIVPKGCFAYNPSRINVGSVDWQRLEERVIVSPLYNVFSVSERIRQQYLYYYLKSDFVLQRIRCVATGSVRDNLKIEMLKEFPITIPTLPEQDRIVKILDDAKRVIDLRKKELDALDKLIKARFVEMFGNPVANEKGWEISLCKNLMSKIGSGATPKGGKESYCDEGISLIRSMNVYNNRFEYKDLAHITDDQAGQLENVTIEKKDVLLNITGASVARCCVVPDDLLPARVNQHVSIIRCKERILPEFLCCMFTEDNYQRLLWNIATAGGATREAITKQQIEELMLIVPPIDLQRQYITFVKRIDKLKSAVQAALDKTQLLFDSLMQEYFG